MLAKRSWRLRQTSSSRAYPPSIYVIRRGGPAAPIAHLDTSGAGTVFLRNFTLSAQLGGLNADGGVLIASDGATLSVAAAGALGGNCPRGVPERHSEFRVGGAARGTSIAYVPATALCGAVTRR